MQASGPATSDPSSSPYPISCILIFRLFALFSIFCQFFFHQPHLNASQWPNQQPWASLQVDEMYVWKQWLTRRTPVTTALRYKAVISTIRLHCTLAPLPSDKLIKLKFINVISRVSSVDYLVDQVLDDYATLPVPEIPTHSCFFRRARRRDDTQDEKKKNQWRSLNWCGPFHKHFWTHAQVNSHLVFVSSETSLVTIFFAR